MMVYKLVLMRHGESIWNLENRFTGWTDVDLTAQGCQEAREAGRALKKAGFAFDHAFTSVLKRAIRTLWLTLEEMDQMWLPLTYDWRLNERHYGALQGLNKTETAQQYGAEQVLIWRRSYDTCPPALEGSDLRAKIDLAAYPQLNAAPLTECLKDTVDRVLPYWQSTIAPAILRGERILISAHGNSLRALIKYLDNISDADIITFNIPNGRPLVYELDAQLRPIRHYYLD